MHFFEEDIKFLLRNKRKLRNWFRATILEEGGKPGTLNFIFCSDSYLLDLNTSYLKHDTLTDIITFDLSENEQSVAGDIFISIERVKENAKSFQISFPRELHRVLIHGILHLLGYKDKTPSQQKEMRSKEDYYLSLLADLK
ncbi:MAG: rRNA maturation RNase YbeY [Chlorobi bacterium]|nr:rRNA maturation RNase YbeY [Chlorobiota bacterium]